MNVRLVLLASVLAISGIVLEADAQHQELSEKPALWKIEQQKKVDERSILQAFKKGSFDGHFRYYFMHTDNEKGLTDYFANAAGGGLRFESANFHHVQFGVSGFYIFNLGSSDFSKVDSISGQTNRYEIGLFDIVNPSNKKDMDRLEEFYLKWNYRKSKITFGKQLLNTPFINLQDGRMRPTGVEGIYAEFNELKHTKLEGGLLYAISPRSTTKWYSIQESIGVYPSGLSEDGKKSNYSGNLSSNYVALVGLHHEVSRSFKFHVWNVYVDQIFNTTLQQLDYTKQLQFDKKVFASLQSIQQFAVKNGGNVDPSKAYILPGSNAFTYGARVGLATRRSEYSLQYNRITSHGRYLMPREWGRDPFFTFLPRERNEGLGDVHAILAKSSFTHPKLNMKTSLGAGHYKTPDVKNVALNKYGLPSYFHVSADLRYQFKGLLQGLEAQGLLVAKIGNGETYGQKKYVLNKTNMALYHLVLNYRF